MDIRDRRELQNPPNSPQVLLNTAACGELRHRRTEVLRVGGYRVIEAASAQEAIRIVTQSVVSLALIAADLPDGDALMLCDTLRRIQTGTSVVLMSSDADDCTTRDAAWVAGAADVLGDRLDDAALLDHVRRALREASRERRADAEILTDDFGLIRYTTEAGARLLNGTARGLSQRNLFLFFNDKREVWHDGVRRAAAGERVCLAGRLRPRERRPTSVTVHIVRVVDEGGTMLRWTFSGQEPA